MKTRTMIKQMLALLVIAGVFVCNGYGMDPLNTARSPGQTKVLLLADQHYDASLNTNDGQKSILEQFESYGWEVEIACCSSTIEPCERAESMGCDVLSADLMTYQVENAAEWDLIMVAPCEHYEKLLKCPFVRTALKQAKASGIPIAAWCRGVNVLAAADILQGIRVSGDPDQAGRYEAAGAVISGSGKHPVADQGIITCAGTEEYRDEMCMLIRNAVEKSLLVVDGPGRKNERLDIKLCPNPIQTSSCIVFRLDKAAEVHIAVFDQQGHMVLDVVRQKFLAGQNKVTFTPSALNTGVYYLYLFSEGKIGMQKCMVI